LKFFEVILFYY